MRLTSGRLSALDQLLALDAQRGRTLHGDLDRFRGLIMEHPEAFRREMLGLAEERHTKLSASAAQALQVLTTDPDLLGPLGFVREETSHTRFLAWVLGPGRRAGLGAAPSRAFWALLHAVYSAADAGVQQRNAALSAEELPALDGSAAAEVSLGDSGRIDVKWDVGDACILIEAKVDSVPTANQLDGYRAWLDAQDRRSAGRALVLLDLAARRDSNDDDDATPDDGREPKHRLGLRSSEALALTWRDVLFALLPVADGPTEAHRAFRAWLKSVAVMEGVAPRGPWAAWTVPQRLAVLDELTNVDRVETGP